MGSPFETYLPRRLPTKKIKGLSKMGMSKRFSVEQRWRRKGFRVIDAG